VAGEKGQGSDKPALDKRNPRGLLLSGVREAVIDMRRIMETDDEFSYDVICAAVRQLEGLKRANN
jgi:hypothetical protein